MKRTSAPLYVYIGFILIVLIMSWEQSRADIALAASVIPEQSIRLRILAHSDGVADQWIKRQVRDAITEQVNAWMDEADTIVEARAVIASRMNELQQRVGGVLAEHGINYAYQVDLGQVEFPTKMYGNQVYPAGKYEALRIVLGEGQGQNWWCVLFPPLCFVDLATGEAVPVQTDEADPDSDFKRQAQSDGTEIRFFLWDMLQNMLNWLKGMVS